jgi:prolyl-tRNA synthetase
MRGVPLRLEIGPKDIEKGQVVLVRRDTREKAPVAIDGLTGRVVELLDEIQQALFRRALAFREEHTTRASSYEELKEAMEGRPGFVIAGWCGGADCEARIKAETQATLRNIPFGSEGIAGACVSCGKPSIGEAWFAKAY